ncbi:MAG: IS200/IS605 family transposase [Rickettsiales bacterium]|jgi:REP element-mobilizing transposase RayT|nr:IS200/IS605 family transposase [Rickettsiales bacterium]
MSKIDFKNIEDEHAYKKHNKNLLLYHFVFVIKYRRNIITEEVEDSMRDICVNISNGYELRFIEIGFDNDHMRLLIQNVPNYNVTSITKILKSIMAREIFKLHPKIRKILYGGSFWTDGYYVNTVGQYSSGEVIIKYIQNQGKNIKEYKQKYIQEPCFDFFN